MIQSGMMTWLTYTLTTQDSNNILWVSQFCLSYSCITIISCSTIETCNLSTKLFLGILSSTHRWYTTSTESKFSVATSSMSTFKWELMNLSRREQIPSKVKTWKNGFGTLLIFKRLLSDATDNHSRTMPVTSLTLSYCFKTSSEDTLMTLSRNHLKSENTELVFEDGKYSFI